MHDVAAMVELLGGMAQKRQLVRLGARDLDLTLAVRSREVVRARQGWYTTLDERSPSVQAVRIGGRLTGLSAIHEVGGWMMRPPPLHVSLPRNAARLRSRWNRHRPLIASRSWSVLRHWESSEVAGRGTAVAVGLRDALIRVVLDEPDEAAIAVLDWATHAGQLDEHDRRDLSAALPAGRRHVVAAVDEGCESFPESIARTRLLAAGHRIRSQVGVDGTEERIDLVIDDRVGLEIDGREFHAETFERDSVKSVSIALMDLIPLRVSATLVLTQWPTVMRAITALLGNSGVAAPVPQRRRVVAPPRRGRRAASPEFPKGRASTGPPAQPLRTARLPGPSRSSTANVRGPSG